MYFAIGSSFSFFFFFIYSFSFPFIRTLSYALMITRRDVSQDEKLCLGKGGCVSRAEISHGVLLLLFETLLPLFPLRSLCVLSIWYREREYVCTCVSVCVCVCDVVCMYADRQLPLATVMSLLRRDFLKPPSTSKLRSLSKPRLSRPPRRELYTSSVVWTLPRRLSSCPISHITLYNTACYNLRRRVFYRFLRRFFPATDSDDRHACDSLFTFFFFRFSITRGQGVTRVPT